MVLSASSAPSPWQWHAHPDVWLLVLVLAGGYALALRTLGPREAPVGKEPATTGQKVAYYCGVIVLWLGAEWPMHELSEEYLFSAHMVQHTLFSLVAPPLLLLGTPSWLLRYLLAPVMSIVRIVTRPLVALVVFNVVIAVTHWPSLVDLSLRVEAFHLAVHTVLVVTATMMWWPVIRPLPELPGLSEPVKMLYLFAQSIVPTVPASFLTFAEEPIYRFYESAPRIWGLDPVTDQMIAGLIMKLGGGLLLWSVITVLFFRWHAKEQAQESEELTWDDFERELETWNLRT